MEELLKRPPAALFQTRDSTDALLRTLSVWLAGADLKPSSDREKARAQQLLSFGQMAIKALGNGASATIASMAGKSHDHSQSAACAICLTGFLMRCCRRIRAAVRACSSDYRTNIL